jgi:hypothetical protein
VRLFDACFSQQVSPCKILGAENNVLQVFFLSFSDLPPTSPHSTKAQFLSVSTIEMSDGPNQAVDYY